MEHDALPKLDSLLDKALEEQPHVLDAVNRLLFAQRKWLVPLVRKELDPRLAARLDPNDVVQEVLGEAAIKLTTYLESRPLPFGAWLYQIAREHVTQAHRTHIKAAKRSVRRETQEAASGSPESETSLECVPARRPAPSSVARRDEKSEKLRAAIEQLTDAEREVLVLRDRRRASTSEIAAQLGITESAVRTRQLRALRRLRELLGEDFM